MEIKNIINDLCNNKISKYDAIDKINVIIDSLINRGETLEFEVTEVSFSSHNNHGYLKIKLPYQYSKIEKKKVKKGDKVNVILNQ